MTNLDMATLEELSNEIKKRCPSGILTLVAMGDDHDTYNIHRCWGDSYWCLGAAQIAQRRLLDELSGNSIEGMPFHEDDDTVDLDDEEDNR